MKNILPSDLAAALLLSQDRGHWSIIHVALPGRSVIVQDIVAFSFFGSYATQYVGLPMRSFKGRKPAILLDQPSPQEVLQTVIRSGTYLLVNRYYNKLYLFTFHFSLKEMFQCGKEKTSREQASAQVIKEEYKKLGPIR